MSDNPGAWWAEAERSARRAVAAERRRARVRRTVRWLPHAGLAVLVVAAVAVAASRTHLADLRWVGVQSASDVQPPHLNTDDLRAGPYLGTPAEQYGEDIVPPPARPLGTHSRDEVAQDLAGAKNLLVLSRLDSRMVVTRSAEPYLAALAPTARAHVTADLAKGWIYASRLAPGEQLLAAPRVTGTMTPALGKDGELTVVTRYVFVYALRPALPVADRAETHVIVRSTVTYAFYAGERYVAADRGAWPVSGADYWYNISCDAAAKGLIALPRPTDARHGGSITPPGTDENMYRLDAPQNTHNDCASGATPSA